MLSYFYLFIGINCTGSLKINKILLKKKRRTTIFVFYNGFNKIKKPEIPVSYKYINN